MEKQLGEEDEESNPPFPSNYEDYQMMLDAEDAFFRNYDPYEVGGDINGNDEYLYDHYEELEDDIMNPYSAPWFIPKFNLVNDFLLNENKFPLLFGDISQEIYSLRIEALSEVYKSDLVDLAKKMGNSLNLVSIVNILVHLAGFPMHTSIIIQGVVPTVNEAMNIFDRNNVNEIIRVSNLINVFREKNNRLQTKGEISPLELWIQRTGEPITATEKLNVDRAILNYGIKLVNRAINIIPKGLDANSRLSIFLSWLDAAESRDFDTLDRIVKQTGQSTTLNWSIPSVIKPLSWVNSEFIYQYFQIKVGRQINDDEIKKLDYMIETSSVYEVLYSLIFTSFHRFSIERLAVYHYFRLEKRNFEKFLFEFEFIKYVCITCSEEITLVAEIFESEEDTFPDCPRCGHPTEQHDLFPVWEEMEGKYQVKIYDLLDADSPASFCSICGYHSWWPRL